ncbi:hypothetical protein BH11PSE12_BH11PSE12_02100 [soil metagenome]
MKYRRQKIIIIVFSVVFFSACEAALSPPKNSTFIVKGNINSAIYPIEVKQDGDDIYIQLKDFAPEVEMLSINFNQVTSFNYKRVGDRLIVPAKFNNIRLHHQGDDDVDITFQAIKAKRSN